VLQLHGSKAYLVNTGWIGGPYGVGKRIDLPSTRAIINAILNGSIEESEFELLPVFNLQVPLRVNGVNPHLLNPQKSWANPGDWDKAARNLAGMFIKNFENFTDNEWGKSLVKAGPHI